MFVQRHCDPRLVALIRRPQGELNLTPASADQGLHEMDVPGVFAHDLCIRCEQGSNGGLNPFFYQAFVKHGLELRG